MHTEITVFAKPIERIKKSCELVGLGAEFERKLPQLETHLEALVAKGEISEDRLTERGLAFIRPVR
jgi:hypothetical protein